MSVTHTRLLTAIMLAIATACSSDLTGPEVCGGPVLTCEPDAARVRWNSKRPPAYDFTLALSCFCGPDVRRPVRIAVTGNTVTSRTFVDDGSAVPAQLTSLYPSIDGLFDLFAAERALNAVRVDVTYDPTVGYPIQISLDRRTEVADDERFYTVSAFTAR